MFKTPSNGKKPKAKSTRPGKAKVQSMFESIKDIGRLKHEAKALSWVLGSIGDDELTE